MNGNDALTPEIMKRLGFGLVEKGAIENVDMQYYAKDAVLFFFRKPIFESDPFVFKAGFGFNYPIFQGETIACTFRWVHTVGQAKQIYTALTGKEL